ncbi:sulfatase-like hydrolase/transferase [Haloarcula sebkhae]|uniref:Sulfatase-like hydrolase/transferase n=2 Tax=Haloarcula sebkhae TaxID=932660 RepID=A0ACC6VMP6_9EURY|nr:sulfatase-like hydrolase/transferase [Haloarcula sebkhae]GGK71237.1 hypothetical protein GCM10009067_24450 [Haloarcula sebkhae]
MDIDVENVLIYVDDAVRYNAINDDLAEIGQTHKTIAASTHTPTSFGSLLTGLLPPNSNIHSFKHSVPANVRSVFDIESHEVSIAAQGGMNHSIAEMFANPPRKSIDDVEPPFVHVARRPGGHAPYDGFDWDDYEYRNETALEYLWRVSSEPETARRDYYNGVGRSFEEFKRILRTLERKGLREETLVIYTSDHGELLGEYGYFGHTHLATPEVVYVPTSFIHPDLDPSGENGLLHHVDILPTVASAMSSQPDFGRVDGNTEEEGRTTGYTHLNHIRYGSLPGPAEKVVSLTGGFERTIKSLWDEHGGHTFVDGHKTTSSIVYLALLLQKPFGRQVVHNKKVRDSYRRFMPGHQSYGNPQFTADEARAEIAELLSGGSEETVRDIDEDTTEQLENMGYL